MSKEKFSTGSVFDAAGESAAAVAVAGFDDDCEVVVDLRFQAGGNAVVFDVFALFVEAGLHLSVQRPGFVEFVADPGADHKRRAFDVRRRIAAAPVAREILVTDLAADGGPCRGSRRLAPGRRRSCRYWPFRLRTGSPGA